MVMVMIMIMVMVIIMIMIMMILIMIMIMMIMIMMIMIMEMIMIMITLVRWGGLQNKSLFFKLSDAAIEVDTGNLCTLHKISYRSSCFTFCCIN